MRVQCVVCDEIEQLADATALAKKLRNRPIHTFMCSACQTRIKEKTLARVETGNFLFRRSSHPAEEEF